MRPPPKLAALKSAAQVLAQLLAIPEDAVRLLGSDADVARVDTWAFMLQWSATGAAGPVVKAAEAARDRAARRRGGGVPVVVVPFMGEVGRARCEAVEVGWLDLCGNARIFAPGIRLVSLGQPNRFKRSGRPSSVFAPKGARVARWLLMRAHRAWSQRELAQAIGIDEGYTSRVVAKLIEDQLIVRDDDGAVRVRDPDLLLDAWQEQYRFDKHDVIRGHVFARSGDELLGRLAERFRDAGVAHAATGLGAAWLLTRFAGFRLTSFYVEQPPSPAWLESVSFREDPRGANVWLIVANDAGVFHGAQDRDGIACVHPVQAYLDLKHHPERAKEAAAELRGRLLQWSAPDAR